MIYLYLLLFFNPFLTWLALHLIPPGNKTLFIVFSFILYFILLLWTFFQIDKTVIIGKSTNYRKILFSSAIILLIGILQFYTNQVRWDIEPHGMDDAIVLWNQKAMVITNSFLKETIVELNRSTWKLQSYPIGLPLSISFISIINSEWSLGVSYIYSILLSLILLFICYTFLLKLKTFTELLFAGIISLIFICRTHYSLVQSDLCADFPISIGLLIFSVSIFSRKTHFLSFFLALNLSWITSLKDEGLLIAFLCSMVFFYSIYNCKKRIKLFLTFIFVYISITLPVMIHKLSIGNISYAFSAGNRSLYEKISNLESYLIISKYFVNYHISEIYSLSIIVTLMVIFLRYKKIEFYLMLLFWTISITYTSIYLFTNLNLIEHLDTSYNRIQSHVWMILYVVLMNSYIKRSRIITESLHLFQRKYFI